MAFLNGPRLLDWANSPPHLQFNKYVLTGYRPISSVQDCVRSLFYLHNELGNIYTHGIPLLCFLVLLPLNIPWSQISVTWLGVVHFLACLSPQLGSVVYHLFMNHEGGEPVYHTLLTLDMCGICMINTLGKLFSRQSNNGIIELFRVGIAGCDWSGLKACSLFAYRRPAHRVQHPPLLPHHPQRRPAGVHHALELLHLLRHHGAQPRAAPALLRLAGALPLLVLRAALGGRGRRQPHVAAALPHHGHAGCVGRCHQHQPHPRALPPGPL
uniref:Progestin and adipoQ receptor family member IVa n=1 Tax=Paramormyrops kingsleyae TaxID=1676925 RepID=A0A3B3T8I7_9TELE